MHRAPLILSIISLAISFDYCTLKCKIGGKYVNHTMCQYREGGGENCASWKSTMTFDMIRTLETRHNKMRELTASSSETYKLGPVPNMLRLAWSDDLMATAQRWADQCEKNMSDVCRTSWKGVDTEQIMFKYYSSDKYFTPLTAIQSLLVSLEKQLEGEITEILLGHNLRILLNSKSDMFGCGFAWSVAKEQEHPWLYEYRLVCNYLMKTGKLSAYKVGEPCSKCPRNTKCDSSSQFPSLCAMKVLQNDPSPVTFCDPEEDYAKKYFREHKSNGCACFPDVIRVVICLMSVFCHFMGFLTINL
ncbi:venom allergen 5-like [Macrosteles quadrilineatus]|uniref:venom allergen 5-like n=1 Tax=Macrosteles quadrilineatus TaxID=74068 RepID=UPI0023E34FD5|nr:venom allergen 5-like [Macrosteles quadrilineatus]